MNAPVRYCPACGEVVNVKVAQKHCSDSEHAIRTKQRDKYCIDCGAKLS